MYGQIPYMISNPYISGANLFGTTRNLGLLSKLNFSNILNGASKALNVANQAIPLYRQVKPMINNIKTIGKIGKEFNKISNNPINNNSIEEKKIQNNNVENIENNVPNPTFFI